MFIVASEGHEVSSELVFQFIVQGLTDRVTVGTVTALVKRGGGGQASYQLNFFGLANVGAAAPGPRALTRSTLPYPGPTERPVSI